MKERMLSLVGFSTQRNSLKTEVLAGITTFVTMSYILALNPVLFAPIADRGYPIEALFTTTALAATIGSLLMAFLAKRPIGQAPGLALNIFFLRIAWLLVALCSHSRTHRGHTLHPAMYEQH